MNKMKKYIIGIGIICVVIIAMVAVMMQQKHKNDGGTPDQVESKNTIDDLQENEMKESAVDDDAMDSGLADSIKEQGLQNEDRIIVVDGEEWMVSEEFYQKYLENKEEAEAILRDLKGDELPVGVLHDVIVTSKLIEDNTVELTLTNMGIFVVDEWILTYESSYDIVETDVAELVMNERLVKQIKSLEKNGTLEPGDSVTIHLNIDGTYHDITKYRVYGRGAGEISPVYDSITYHVDTKETTLNIYDVEENDVQGPVTTQGLDVNPE